MADDESQGNVQAARQELTLVLGEQPNHSEAAKLNDVVQAIATGPDR
jgi:hypothetical protein